MLWKKESNNPNALYMDLFVNQPLEFMDFRLQISNADSTLKKNDEISLQKRKEGNGLFDNGKWAETMEKYNESLCFAPNDSENISLAYANRALCFLRLKLYKECLIDIGLARQAGYPKRLMFKLDQRESECLKYIEDGAQFEEFDQKLSFDPDENFPCMANVLKIQRNQMGDLSVIANEDIDVGQTIVHEKAFLACLYNRFGWKCNICLKDNTNLKPCNKCASAMFCSDECQQNVLHEYECGHKFQDKKSKNGFYMQTLRALTLAINLFSNLDELMSFVEEAVKSDPEEIPASLKDDRSKYRAFLKLPINKKNDSIMIREGSSGIYNIYTSCLKVVKIGKMFESLKLRRFLMHLIGHIVLISMSNTCHVPSQLVDRYDLYHQLGLMPRYFNHSCAPNMWVVEREGLSVCRTVRPIKKGNELFISYCSCLSEPKKERQRSLYSIQNIICKCTRCEGQLASTEQRQQLISDPNYQSILRDMSKLNVNDIKKTQDTIQKCVDFLRSYDQIEFCDEIAKVIDAYNFIEDVNYTVKHPTHRN